MLNTCRQYYFTGMHDKHDFSDVTQVTQYSASPSTDNPSVLCPIQSIATERKLADQSTRDTLSQYQWFAVVLYFMLQCFSFSNQSLGHMCDGTSWLMTVILSLTTGTNCLVVISYLFACILTKLEPSYTQFIDRALICTVLWSVSYPNLSLCSVCSFYRFCPIIPMRSMRPLCPKCQTCSMYPMYTMYRNVLVISKNGCHCCSSVWDWVVGLTDAHRRDTESN